MLTPIKYLHVFFSLHMVNFKQDLLANLVYYKVALYLIDDI